MKLNDSFRRWLMPALFTGFLTTTCLLLLTLPQNSLAQSGYWLFVVLVGLGYYATTSWLKHAASLLSVLIIIVVGIVFPLDVEVLEEAYLFIPLLYLFIYPGSFYPIGIAVLLLSAYLPSVPNYALAELLEDVSELIVISSFATVMTYFQQNAVKQMQRFWQESRTDDLTKFPNRKRLIECVGQLMQANLSFGLLVVDLDGFKRINDQLGHSIGDQLLVLVANRMNLLTSPSCQLFHLGGDEFALLLNQQDALTEKTQSLADEIIRQSAEPYRLQNKSFYISASIGIACFPEHAQELQSLLSYADMAMYRAKSQGKQRYSLFNNELLNNNLRRYKLENHLKRAIEKNELHLVYQPKVAFADSKVDCAEVLLRWQHTKLGAISPVEFIPIAEQSHLIVDIGNWVLESVCKQIVEWKQHYQLDRVSVNVSPQQLAHVDFISSLEHILRRTGCQPEWLEIEQTEGWMMENPDDNIAVFKRLKVLGVRLSLDDFGVAYSSLSQIARLPLDVLKIDKSFVEHCEVGSREHMIVRTVIQLGRNLKLQTVAEGVETEAQRQILDAEGCDMYQGYLFSKPVDGKTFVTMLEKKPQADIPHSSKEHQPASCPLKAGDS